MASSNPTAAKLPLSSNWKALQKTLKRKEPEPSSTSISNTDAKSKEDDGPSAKRVKSDATKDVKSDAKKDKVKKENKKDAKKDGKKDTVIKLSKKDQKKKKMMKSKLQTDADSKFTPSASLALWAEDNDISPEDLVLAYGVPASTTTETHLSNEPMYDPTPFKAQIPTTTSSASATSSTSTSTSPPPITFNKPTSIKELNIGRYIAIDCEMVGVGSRAERSALARVSIVNYHGHCVIDLFVKPKEKVTDWRTWVSGVTPKHMKNAVTFEVAQQTVSDLMKGRIVVGHALKNDFDALLLSHPRPDTRDTSTCRSLKEAIGRGGEKGGVGLKKLAKQILKIDIQGGKHSSIEDARACMLLYRKYKNDFEKEHIKKFPNYDRNHLSGDSKGNSGSRREPRTKKPKKPKSKSPPTIAAKVEEKKLIISSE